MSSDWASVEIASICEGIYDGPHATPKKTSHGPIFLGISCLDKGRLDLANVEHLSEADFSKWTKRVTPTGKDIVFSYETRLGEAAMIPEGLRCCLGRRMALMRIDLKKAVPEYVLYAYMSPEFQETIRARTVHGSTVDRIALKEFGAFPLALPNLDTQLAIVTILRALDDRITLLRETNKTLESIAQALFKSWFVDFDPVRAKMEGRQPEGMDEETAALFPDSFEESELGPIPKGWQVGTVGDAIDTLGGATPNTKNAAFWSPEEFHWTTPKDLSGAVSPILLDTDRRISAAGLAKISSGLLPIGTLLMSSRAPIGYLTLCQIPVAINQGYIAMPPGGKLPPLFMYFWCKTNMDVIKGNANGSTFMEISKKAFRPIQILVPPDNILAAFTRPVRTLFDKIRNNAQRADVLTSLRDSLLPRLISGRLRLLEAESIVSEVSQ